MSSFFRQIVKTLLTGEKFIDNYQRAGDSTLAGYSNNLIPVPDTYYNFNWLTSNNADFHFQYRSADIPGVDREFYSVVIEFDETILNALTGPVTLSVNSLNRTSTIEINGSASPFSTSLKLLKPNEYSATDTATGLDQLIDTAVAFIRKQFPDYIVSRNDEFIFISSRFIGTFYNLIITITGTTGAVSILSQLLSLNDRYDQQFQGETGQYDVVLDVYKISDSFERTSTRLDLTSLNQSFSDDNFYKFNLKSLFNTVHKRQPMINQIFVDPPSGDDPGIATYSGIVPAYLEPFNDYNIQTYSRSAVAKIDEQIVTTVKVFDAKWDTLADERLFDYILKNPLNPPTIPAAAVRELKFRFTFDVTIPFTGEDIVTIDADLFPSTTISLIASLLNTTYLNSIELSNTVAPMLERMSSSYYNWLQTEPLVSATSSTCTTTAVNEKYGYVDFVFYLPESAALITGVTTSETPQVKFTYSHSVGITNPQPYSLNQTVWFNEDFSAWQPIKLLNSYREAPTKFWQLQHGAPAEVSPIAKVLDVYYTVNWISSAWVSAFCLHPGFVIPGESLHLNSRLIMSQMRITHESGLVSWDNYGCARESGDRLIPAAIVQDIVWDNPVSEYKTPGLIQFNWSAHMYNTIIPTDSSGIPWIQTLINSGDRPAQIEFTLDQLVIHEDMGFTLPTTQSIRLIMHQLQPGEHVHEFAFKGRLGGMTSLTIVDQRQETIKSTNNLRSNIQEYESETFYETGAGSLIQKQDLARNTYTPYYVLDTVSSEGTYQVNYTTTDYEEYIQLRDFADSEQVYYRVLEPDFNGNISQSSVIWIPIKPDVDWSVKETREYTMSIKWQLMSDSNNVLRVNNKIQ